MLAGSVSFRQLLLAIFSYKLNRANHPSRRSTVSRSLLGRGKSSDSSAAVNSYFAFFQNDFILHVICRVLFSNIFETRGEIARLGSVLRSWKLKFRCRQSSSGAGSRRIRPQVFADSPFTGMFKCTRLLARTPSASSLLPPYLHFHGFSCEFIERCNMRAVDRRRRLVLL